MKVSVFCFWFFRNFGRSCHNNCSCTYSKLKIAIMARKKKVRENFIFCRHGSWAVLAMLVLGQAWVYRYVSPQIESRKSNQVPFLSMLKTGITLWLFKHLKDRSSKIIMCLREEPKQSRGKGGNSPCGPSLPRMEGRWLFNRNSLISLEISH